MAVPDRLLISCTGSKKAGVRSKAQIAILSRTLYNVKERLRSGGQWGFVPDNLIVVDFISCCAQCDIWASHVVHNICSLFAVQSQAFVVYYESFAVLHAG